MAAASAMGRLTSWVEALAAAVRRLAIVWITLVLWEVAARTALAGRDILPPFSSVLAKIGQMAATGELWGDVAVSFERMFMGFAFAVVVAIPLGFIVAWFETPALLLNPVIEFFRNSPPLALYPLIILILGFSEFSKAGIVFWGALWPSLLNTIDGVKSVDPLLIRAARSMGVGRLTLFWKVILPAAFPSMFTGIRLSASRAVIILVGAEMLGADRGLGHLVFFAENHFQLDKMYAGILSLILMGLSVNYSLVALEHRVTRWRPEPAAS